MKFMLQTGDHSQLRQWPDFTVNRHKYFTWILDAIISKTQAGVKLSRRLRSRKRPPDSQPCIREEWQQNQPVGANTKKSRKPGTKALKAAVRYLSMRSVVFGEFIAQMGIFRWLSFRIHFVTC